VMNKDSGGIERDRFMASAHGTPTGYLSMGPEAAGVKSELSAKKS